MTERKGLINFSILIIFFNLIFIGLAVYREQVQNQWMNGLTRPDTAFLKLQQLTSYSDAILFIYPMTILAIGIWFMLKRSNHLQSFILKNVRLVFYFLVLGILLAFAIDTAIINLTQQLLGPMFILIPLALFQFAKRGFRKYKTT